VIFLSWIQHFFERFKKDDEALHHEIHTNKRPIKENRHPHNNKDLDARITYQYPKGHFRFPIIPDVVKQSHQVKKQHPEAKKQPQARIHSHKDHEVKFPKEKELVKQAPLTKVHYSGPFRPTEIPSPIFGFNRPKETVVEYELSDFANGTSESLEDLVIRDSVEQKESVAAAETESIDVIEELQIISGNTGNAVEIDIESEKKVVQSSELSQTLDDNEFKSNEDVLDLGMDDEHQEDGPDERIQSVSEINSGSEEAEAALVQDIFLENSEQVSHEETNYSGTEGEMEHLAGENEKSSDHLEAEKPKRMHLPFNVMMLKQDKQRWEERSKRKHLENKAPLQQSSVESFVQKETDRESSSAENTVTDSYQFPDFQLLNPPVVVDMDTEWLQEQEKLLNQTLENFNVGANVVNITQGPSVTRFEVHPEPGVKVNKVTNLTDDIKLSLAARDIRIEAPIPGKHTIGIEVPNQKSRPVQISEIIQSSVFRDSSSPLTAVLGLDISGRPIVTDLKKMPHGLIAGATGSGKSVCINTILVSLLYKASPDELKLLLIDPKMVELAPYNRIPHLVSPVITDVKAATASLKWAVDEMERRYELFAHTGVRDINKFNELVLQDKRYSDKLPFIVIIIDELADLMMMSPADVEEAICRIAQKARACGIHLIIATQRPSVDVITGLIKANIPTRIAFSVSSQVDSRTIIDIGGAEKLLGRGDMLFLENGSSKPVRLQGTFVSDDEIDTVVAHVREQQEPNYLFEQEELLKKAQNSEEEDELFYEACEFVVDQSSASTSSLQRRFKIGYNRAARLMEMMEQQGYISSSKGSKPRDVFITAADLESIQETGI
jgi:S-DNA-T family DNA segregation ATPase FtsK/SpoIIIE